MLTYFREFDDLEDLGLDKEDGAGIVTILSNAITQTDNQPRYAPGEPWFDFER